MPEIIIVDTTLRDGEQAPGFAFAPALKIRLASMLDEAGVDQIEAGVPAMGENEKATIRSIREACANARVSTWNRLRESDVRHIVYSSCNAASLARDIAELADFQPREARLFDMFPHTHHYEVACLLERRETATP